ncbi:MAG TPA: transcriptional repressor LexA [Ruminococcaceae bacterium]|nr:transcriptional repressor LexA [Oscillospiraceae bacterium]
MRSNHREEIYRFVQGFYEDNGYAPSLSQIAHAVGMSSRSAVQRQIRKLVDERRLAYLGGKYVPVRKQASLDVQMVPLIGTIAAGIPIEAIEEFDGYVAYLPETISRDRTLFALRIRGRSMIEVGIFDRDIVIVEQRSDAENGQIIAAMIDGEATVKTFYKENGHFRLQPENSDMQPIIVNHVDVLGRVIAVQRYY